MIDPFVDQLHPQASTWARGFTLAPATPRIRAAVASVYRDFASASKTDAERAYYVAQVVKWEGP
jgi:hypothetical protein